MKRGSGNSVTPRPRRACMVIAVCAVVFTGWAYASAASGHPAPRGDVAHAIRLASVVYGVSERELQRVAWCESRYDAGAVNASGDATGLFQFLRSTWARYPFRGFPRSDPFASALAAAYVRKQDGSWRQWTASRRCWR